MRRVSSIVLLGTLVLMAGGCSSEDTSTAPPAPPPAVVVPKNVPPKQPFAKPVVTQKPGSPIVARASIGLIQPTNAEERVRQIQKGRKDPFGLYPVVPVALVQTPDPNASTSGSNVPRTSTISNPTRLPTLPNNRRPATRRPTTITTRTPTLPPLIVPPPLPEPDAARAVAVTGVVEVGGEVQAIVKAPDEPTSRYVRVGQRLSNGRVLVKRIELNQGGDPIVILEQFGIEVTRAVGEKPEAAATTPTDASTIPPS